MSGSRLLCLFEPPRADGEPDDVPCRLENVEDADNIKDALTYIASLDFADVRLLLLASSMVLSSASSSLRPSVSPRSTV